MGTSIKLIAVCIITAGLYSGVRYIGSAIHYGCDPDPIVNVEDGDDCPPPFRGVGELAWYLTGGSLVPLSNHDATAVRKVSWSIENVRAGTHQQKIAALVTTYDGKTKEYDLGTAFGCTGTTTNELQNRTIVIGRVTCTFAESDTTFVAFRYKDGFSIDRSENSAKDGSTATTLVDIALKP